MCLEIRKTCQCGEKNAQFHMRDNVMSREVVVSLYCPNCSPNIQLDKETMIYDKDWIIEYDIELAQFLAAAKLNIPPDMVSPDYLFDTGYAAWQEMYPGEQKDILDERKDIMDLLNQDPKKYLEEMNSWNIARIEQLKTDGWRKAQAA